jgi:hypothetical protein
MEEDLARLVRETVKVEVENHMRTRSSELIGRGGDVVLGGMGNIYLQPGVNKKAYYKGTEIGTGGGGGGTITGSGTINYIPKFTGATAIGNSHLIDDGSTITSSEDIEMLAKKTVYYNGLKTGEIYSKKTAVETIDYYGLQITPYNTHGTNPGSLYIGDDNAAPAGTGIKVTDTAISLVPVSGGQINVYGTLASQETEGTSLYRMKINDSATPPSVGKGGIYIDTDDNNLYINKGTYAVPNWQPLGSAIWGGITGTLSNQTDLQTALDAKLSLTGGTLTNDLTIKDASPMLYFTDDSDAPLGSIGSLGAGLYIKNDVASGSIYIQTGSGAGTTRIQVYDTGVALGVPLVMGSNAITTNSTVDGVDVSAIPSTYLPLAGGTMTGAIAHAAYDASFADGYGIDFRNDNVHKINYTYASNTLDFSTYQRFDFLTTVDSSVDFSILYDSIICHEPLYFRHAHGVSNCYIVDDASGTMELHVPSGQKLKVIIG